MRSLPNPKQLYAFETLIRSFDFFLCVDLEATCDELMPSEDTRPLIVTADEMETIEVGLVVLDLQTLKIVGAFQRFVRPVLNPNLTSFCTGLTSIQQADVDNAQAFPEVALELTAFLQKYPNALWGSWGQYDAEQIAADTLRANCAPMLLGVDYLDLEQKYCEIFDYSTIRLRPAVEALGLSWAGRYHRGIDDARNLANIVALLMESARKIE